MLSSRNAMTNLAVRDVARARKFYEGVLGLEPVDTEGDSLVVYRSGDSRLLVYESTFAGTNKATAATWAVEDVDGEVKTLREKGVRFEHYDMPEMKEVGDVYVAGEMRIAWFKDPDGNVLSIVNGGDSKH